MSPSARHIAVTDLKGCMLFACDINVLLPDPHSLSMISARVSGNWIDEVRSRLVGWDEFGYDQPRLAESEYGKTARGARNTFSRRHVEESLPLVTLVAEPRRRVSGKLRYWVEAISLSPQGALSVRIAVRQRRAGDALSAQDLVHGYHRLASRTSQIVMDAIERYVGFWNARMPDDGLVVPDGAIFAAALHSYDIWDYEFVLLEGGVPVAVTSVKALFAEQDTTPAQELTAIANMDVADVESLKDVRLNQFTDSDIGTRDDELWSVGRERMTRRHPERAVSFNMAFFNDVKLAVEVLLGHQSTLEFMEDWVRRQRRLLLDEILGFDDLTDVRKQDLQRRYSDVIRASQILVEPLAVEQGAKHAFFAEIVTRVAAVLELDVDMGRSSRAVSEFAALVESVSGFHDAQLNANLATIQVDLARNSRRLAQLAIGLGVVGVVLAAAQIWVALNTGHSSPNTKPPATSSTQQPPVSPPATPTCLAPKCVVTLPRHR